MNDKRGDVAVFLLVVFSLIGSFSSLGSLSFFQKDSIFVSRGNYEEEVQDIIINEISGDKHNEDNETVKEVEGQEDELRQNFNKVICYDGNCFQERFSSCQKAELVVREDLAENRLEILGLENGSCQVGFIYLKNPFSNLVGKEMTCSLDNSENFEVELEKAFELLFIGGNTCQGALAEALVDPLNYQ